jgi:HlyD family secretion protein
MLFQIKINQSCQIMKNHILLLLLFLASVSCKKEAAIINPELNTITEAVYASGYVVPKSEYQVFSKAEGFLVKKLVADGEAVKAGEPLFYIENEQQNSKYRNALDLYEMARNNYKSNSPILEEITSGMEASRKKLVFDSIQYERFKNLIGNNAASKLDYDRAKLSYENSQNEYILQKTRYEKVKNQLFIELRNAENQLKISTDENSNNIIKSRIDGRLYQTLKEEGELIKRNEAIAVVGNNDSFHLQLQIDELDINKVKVGQQVLVKIDAFPKNVFKAQVKKIYPLINKKDQSIRVDAEFTEEIPLDFSGLAAEANIIIKQKENALLISRSFLINEDSVMVMTNGKKDKIKVTIGIETLEKVEVISGLDKDSQLIMK